MDEHDECAKIAEEIAILLKARGNKAMVIDFPHESNDHDLTLTVHHCNFHADEIDCIVSLHCDCYSSPEPQGAHVCYISSEGKKLASCIANKLCAFMPGRADKVVKRTGLLILRKTEPVCVLIEHGFLSNERDAHCIKNCKKTLAHLIVSGIEEYFNNKD